MKKALLYSGIIGIASVLCAGNYVNAESVEKEIFVNEIEELPKGSISNPAYRGKVEQMVRAHNQWGMRKLPLIKVSLYHIHK
ncbi:MULTISPECIES: hypothetical protein [Bacillus cereus group]|nr:MULTISPECIES: hypothetical protein [Bacillus cereus group]AWC31572.1 hypothetical protein CG482_003335 [Bacillus cytotoxicus]AWC35612.1 hypothetical protein CG481_003335 [Bacillus cytotoxicus]AWC59844.1 hypothetical protein CG474_003400 [Bacillus cytotoxicus]KMT49957.1 hypothetical protein TU51_11245 [Bacillus cytotoxicus]